jgi:hypothetical protein
MAKQTINKADPKFYRQGKLNKASVMRCALETLGVHAPTKDITAWVKANFDVELTTSDKQVALSNYRKQVAGGSKPTNGRSSKPFKVGTVATATQKPTQAVSATPTSSNGALGTLRKVKEAVKACGGKEELIQYVEEMDSQ